MNFVLNIFANLAPYPFLPPHSRVSLSSKLVEDNKVPKINSTGYILCFSKYST